MEAFPCRRWHSWTCIRMSHSSTLQLAIRNPGVLQHRHVQGTEENRNGWQRIFSTLRNIFWIKKESKSAWTCTSHEQKAKLLQDYLWTETKHKSVFHIQKGYCCLSSWTTGCGLNLQKKTTLQRAAGHCVCFRSSIASFLPLSSCAAPHMSRLRYIRTQKPLHEAQASWAGFTEFYQTDHTKKKFTELWNS